MRVVGGVAIIDVFRDHVPAGIVDDVPLLVEGMGGVGDIAVGAIDRALVGASVAE